MIETRADFTSTDVALLKRNAGKTATLTLADEVWEGEVIIDRIEDGVVYGHLKNPRKIGDMGEA